MIRGIKFVVAIAMCVIFITGCGETVSAIGKDTSRMGRGINTFFFRQP